MNNTKLIQEKLDEIVSSLSIAGQLTEENGTKALIIDTCNKLKEAKSLLMQQGEGETIKPLEAPVGQITDEDERYCIHCGKQSCVAQECLNN